MINRYRNVTSMASLRTNRHMRLWVQTEQEMLQVRQLTASKTSEYRKEIAMVIVVIIQAKVSSINRSFY